MSEGDGYYYHVLIIPKLDNVDFESKFDLDRDKLISRIVEPYNNGNSIVINGKSIDLSSVERIQVCKTKEPSDIILTRYRYVQAISVYPEWNYLAKEGRNVTDEFIVGPPGFKIGTKDNLITKKNTETKKIFIVHGHNEEMKQAVARTIGILDLEPIILHEQPNEGLKTIIEKFEKYSSDASFAIVLLSPDDKGCTVDAFPNAAKLRSRQNVILELGYFMGKLGRERVFALYKGSNNFELPSDIRGTIYAQYDNKWQFELVRELKACGYKVDANKLL